jgi:hypothetical protein
VKTVGIAIYNLQKNIVVYVIYGVQKQLIHFIVMIVINVELVIDLIIFIAIHAICVYQKKV